MNYNPVTKIPYGCIAAHNLDPELFADLMDAADSNEGSDSAPKYEGVEFEIFELGGAAHVMVIQSPVKGSYSPCSPCVPGAGDLDTPNEGGIECYDVPVDWRLADDD